MSYKVVVNQIKEDLSMENDTDTVEPYIEALKKVRENNKKNPCGNCEQVDCEGCEYNKWGGFKGGFVMLKVFSLPHERDELDRKEGYGFSEKERDEKATYYREQNYNVVVGDYIVKTGKGDYIVAILI